MLREGLELLNHVPAEDPSEETRAALGAMLMREAPRAVAAPAGSSRPAWVWGAAAAVLLVTAAGGLVWKLMTPETKPQTVIAHHEPEIPAPKPVPVVPTPKPLPKPAPTPKAVDPALAWDSAAHDDIDTLSDTIKDLRGTSVAVKPTFDRTTVWVPKASAVDTMYESLESITTTSDKF